LPKSTATFNLHDFIYFGAHIVVTKGLVHPKIKIHVATTNPYDFHSSSEDK